MTPALSESITTGARIKARRQQMDLSRTGLGRLARRHPDTIKQIEDGRRNASPRTLYQLAAALQTTPEELRGEAPPTPSGPAAPRKVA